ncbi:hypothetical protein Tco_0229738, partial [Tanacetum coccineum]
HYIQPGLSSKTRALWKLSCLLEAAHKSLVSIRLGLKSQCCLYALVVDQASVLFVRHHTTYIRCQCTRCGGDNASSLEKALLLTSL